MSESRWARPVAVACLAASAAGFVSQGCSFDSSSSAFASDAAESGDAATWDAGASGAAPGTGVSDGSGPTARGVVLVHAADAPAFRLCFDNELDRLPLPDEKLMPEANVVGAEVGSAVRLDPLKGTPGRTYLYEEALIRSLYAPGQKPQTCKTLVESPAYAALKPIVFDDVDADLSSGVHLLVLTGCAGDTTRRTKTKAECGEDYDGSTPKGNLKLREQTLYANSRATGTLPVQVVHLSETIERLRGSRALTVSFDTLVGDGGADAVSIAVDPPLFGGPVPSFPMPIPLDGKDTGIFEKQGFRVAFTSSDGGSERLVEQALDDVQYLSSPTDVPTTYYGAASNYVLLLLGDPAPKLPDGGVDGDERRRPHFLAVPVVDPNADAGADAGSDGTDAGVP